MAVRADQTIEVDGLKTRYVEEGTGPAVVLMHGSALGSSCDVWERHLAPLAAKGLRVVAFDRPGFGGTADPSDTSAGYQQSFVPKLMDALKIDQAGLVGHSQTGNFAVNLALEQPARISRIMVLGTGSLLPPLEGQQAATGPAPNENVYGREPTREDIRRVLEDQLYDHALITPELIEARLHRSLGHKREQPAPRPAGGGGGAPAWERLANVKVPMLLMYGKQDRPTTEAQVNLLKQRAPQLDVRLVDRCKHLIQLDVADEFQAAAAAFFTS